MNATLSAGCAASAALAMAHQSGSLFLLMLLNVSLAFMPGDLADFY